MRTQQDRTKQNRLVLPLGQTVFLPQTAMGVSYIDKVRTKVYIDNLQRQEGRRNACLRGFYEIDLEYHGLEGQRLYKHRVMLPLRVELPDDWLLPLDYEADELHAVISKPMLRILSPYVLEFSGQLVVEYVGDLMHRFDDDCDDDDDDDHDHKPDCDDDDDDDCDDDDRRHRRLGRHDYRLPYIYQEQTAAASQSEAAETQEVQERLESKYHLPVWSAQPDEAAVEVAALGSAEAKETVADLPGQEAAKAPAAKTVADEGVLPSFDDAERSKMRTLLTNAAISRLQAKGEELINAVASDELSVRPVGVAKSEAVQEVILISEGEKEMAQLTAATVDATTETAAAQPVEAAMPAEVLAENEAAAVEAAQSVEAAPTMAMAETESEPEMMLTEAAEREILPTEAANELAEAAAAAAAEANEAALETMAAAEPVAEQPVSVANTLNVVNANGVRLRVGLREPSKITPAVSTNSGSGAFRLKYYVVKPGDDPMSIALQHNVPLESLRAANQALVGDLSVGMVLRIPS